MKGQRVLYYKEINLSIHFQTHREPETLLSVVRNLFFTSPEVQLQERCLTYLFTSPRSLQPCSLGCEVKGADAVRMLTEEKAQHNIIFLWCCARREHYQLLGSIPGALLADTLSVIPRHYLKKRLIWIKSCWVCYPNTWGWFEKWYYVSLQITPPKNIKNN